MRYTPVRSFNGSETFTYTVADSNGKQSTAKVTLHTLPYVNAATDVVYSLRTTDLNGNLIGAVRQGQDFKLDVFVDDFRNYPEGTADIGDATYELQVKKETLAPTPVTLSPEVRLVPPSMAR